MNRDFSRAKVRRIPRKNKRHTVQPLKTSQLNLTHRSSLKSTRFCNVFVNRLALPTITKSKQNKINHEGQNNRISLPAKKETNQSNISSRPRDSPPINSITNSRTCFDLSYTHRSLSRMNGRNLFENSLTLDTMKINEKKKKKKKKKKPKLILWKIGLCAIILFSFLGGLIGVLIYVLKQSKNSETTTVASMITTTQNSACTAGGITCPTPMFAWNRTHNCSKPAASYLYYTCCYQAITTQLTIEFILQEDVSNWYIDDVSITQGNGELLINGGFESNLTGWTAISSISNLSITPVAEYLPSAAHAGSIYLHSEAKSTPDHIKQTVSVIQGQNVNISFWWLDEGGVPAPTEICEATVTLT